MEWSLGKKLGFRFILCFLVLFALPFPLSGVPGLNTYAYQWLNLNPVVDWVGKSILGMSELKQVFTGSGDTTYGWVTLLTVLLLSLLITGIWSVLDRKRPHYDKLAPWLICFARYFLASVMFSYGMSKVFKLQFPEPGPLRMYQTVGDLAPMSLVWIMMGQSTFYCFIAGLGEVVGGALLLFRRTVTLGALILIGVMGNVVLLNFCFDVPVKIYSSLLFSVAVGLFLLDGRRLVGPLFGASTNRERKDYPLFQEPRFVRAALIFKVIVVGYVTITGTYSSYQRWQQFGPGAPPPPLFGVYEVDSFVYDGEELPPVYNDTLRWRRLMVDHGYLGTQTMDGKVTRYRCRLDPEKRSAHLTARITRAPLSLTYEEPEPGQLVIQTTLNERPVEIRLHKVEPKFLIQERGFNWINEVPYNP